MWYYSVVVERRHADIAQQVERILGKDEVAGSNPAISSGPGTVDINGVPGFLCCPPQAASIFSVLYFT